MKATVTERDLTAWRPIIEHGTANELMGILVDVCDGSMPGDFCEIPSLKDIEDSDLGKASPFYEGQRRRCVKKLLFEITGDLQYQIR